MIDGLVDGGLLLTYNATFFESLFAIGSPIIPRLVRSKEGCRGLTLIQSIHVKKFHNLVAVRGSNGA